MKGSPIKNILLVVGFLGLCFISIKMLTYQAPPAQSSGHVHGPDCNHGPGSAGCGHDHTDGHQHDENCNHSADTCNPAPVSTLVTLTFSQTPQSLKLTMSDKQEVLYSSDQLTEKEYQFDLELPVHNVFDLLLDVNWSSDELGENIGFVQISFEPEAAKTQTFSFHSDTGELSEIITMGITPAE
ncbi:hypothetical protein [Persicirhabdus sediminis]|uniref:Uncharacterized protein n=1 Tax=Persicirhabdus sediminis TaxID=454144 RepID=A0A8J7SIV0_9BACT|nr:hypothetical protein [Persicirhabdus sediminis]MBK1790889.1 hypothetical protein [Persicirhabdus sediminis]